VGTVRLPAVTPQQKQHEASRQFHEALYTAFLGQHGVIVTVTPETANDEQLSVSSRPRAFWRARGFRIRTRIEEQKTVLRVWLEPMVAPEAPRVRKRDDDDLVWQQRTA
jgi:hypothetical protein